MLFPEAKRGKDMMDRALHIRMPEDVAEYLDYMCDLHGLTPREAVSQWARTHKYLSQFQQEKTGHAENFCYASDFWQLAGIP